MLHHSLNKVKQAHCKNVLVRIPKLRRFSNKIPALIYRYEDEYTSKRILVGGVLGWVGSLLVWHNDDRNYRFLKDPVDYVQEGCITTGLGTAAGTIVGYVGLRGWVAMSVWGVSPLVSYYRKRSLDPNAKRIQT